VSCAKGIVAVSGCRSAEHRAFPLAFLNLSFTVIAARKIIVFVMIVCIDVIRVFRV
jgi:hypothetical protein